jgi:dihydroxyacid dehydratase/phosphogluconate dehydratase
LTGSESTKFALVSRKVIIDSIENIVGRGGMDGYVVKGGCNKSSVAKMEFDAKFRWPNCCRGKRNRDK